MLILHESNTTHTNSKIPIFQGLKLTKKMMQTKSKYPISQKLKDYLGIEFLENVA